MTRLLRKLAQMSAHEALAASVWDQVSRDALARRGPAIYEMPLVPGFEETRADRILSIPEEEEYYAQMAQGYGPRPSGAARLQETGQDIARTRKTLRMLRKLSSAWGQGADDEDVRRYAVKDTNPSGRDYSAQRERDIQTGLDSTWTSHETFTPGSESPLVSGKNPILERGPRWSKEGHAALRDAVHRLKQALQVAARKEDGSSYNQDRYEHAELTDEQQQREISDAFDPLPHYAPHSPEGTVGNPIFVRSAKTAEGPDFTEEAGVVEDDDSRGLSQWPYVLNDSRDAPRTNHTSRAWAEHDSFDVGDALQIDPMGNPGPAV